MPEDILLPPPHDMQLTDGTGQDIVYPHETGQPVTAESLREHVAAHPEAYDARLMPHIENVLGASAMSKDNEPVEDVNVPDELPRESSYSYYSREVYKTLEPRQKKLFLEVYNSLDSNYGDTDIPEDLRDVLEKLPREAVEIAFINVLRRKDGSPSWVQRCRQIFGDEPAIIKTAKGRKIMLEEAARGEIYNIYGDEYKASLRNLADLTDAEIDQAKLEMAIRAYSFYPGRALIGEVKDRLDYDDKITYDRVREVASKVARDYIAEGNMKDALNLAAGMELEPEVLKLMDSQDPHISLTDSIAFMFPQVEQRLPTIYNEYKRRIASNVGHDEHLADNFVANVRYMGEETWVKQAIMDAMYFPEVRASVMQVVTGRDWGFPDWTDDIRRAAAKYNKAEERYEINQDGASDLDPGARVETVRQLRLSDENRNSDKAPYFLQRLEYNETHPSPYAPTLGIEIEIYRPTLGLPATNEYMPSEAADRSRQLQERFRLTQSLGVPKGDDGYWEFANAPVNHFGTLTREVQALIDMGLINREYTKHPMHLTIGGVTSEGPEGEQAFTLLRALEATGWSTKGRRLLKPYLSNKPAWNYKGQAGISERSPGDIKGDSLYAIEIRTMQFQNLHGLHRLLSASYYLGAALKAYQETQFDAPIEDGATEAGREELSEIWTDFAAQIGTIFDKYGMNLPTEMGNWEAPRKDNQDESGFWRLAELMDQADADKTSQGAKFVSEVRDAIGRTRVQAAKIVQPQPEPAVTS